MPKRALTFIEILLATAIIGITAAAVIASYPPIFEGVNISAAKTKAWELARRQMESLRNSNFTEMLIQAYDPVAGQPPIANSFSTTGLGQSSGVYYLKKLRDSVNVSLTDLLEAEVVVCFSVYAKAFGEDTNFNATLDANEDANNNTKIDSPVNLRTLILRP
jgi:type II secretory pathway pseudopilin PulG